MRKKLPRLLSLWLPPALWALIIFLFSSLSVTPTSDIYWKDFVVKKLAHMLEYGIFAVLLYRALRESGLKRLNAALITIFSSMIYGITDEYHQSFTPGREPRARDVIFDTIGAIAGTYLVDKKIKISNYR